ncbi:hypothetical protein DL766_001519 [Monosporascus sp. MC13-8B]|uniref:Uncharacterized protein n=1 Tax=Monosporascus cannonballus TaxID=155416 RepID=A0ABY0H1M8_9PEZI|nr:hypothetical protein DL762_006580 [Monosporascus cannonballus]RYO99856.1 hypothetical protein DL763_001246 [Monosporascus cannonballus]RYP37525.1 hypothetical protein DL766_001519 [Monosporascus sp. MC13-8B]
MTKAKRSDSGSMPPRSESFLRMLELEKMYKMQRVRDNTLAVTSAPTRNSESAQPSSAPRTRRASGHPPLSNRQQIMKAMSRSSTLPPLSISIPSLSTPNTPPRPSLSQEEPPLVKEERTKTVTFSDPYGDESDLSDQSSICHSPSWEGWSKKTTRSKKSDLKQAQKINEETSAKVPKKKGNRLSKPPPQTPLIPSNRSQSTPELETRHKHDATGADVARLGRQDKMAEDDNQKQSDDRSKNRRFLSGFKLQHGNGLAGKRLAENSPVGAQGHRPSQDEGSSVPQSKKSHTTGTGINTGFMSSWKPTADSSSRSHSSLEKRPLSMRPPSAGSNHARSQSLLSSTLNKLRGPSYLYHRPREGSSNSAIRPPSRDDEVPQPTAPPMERPSSSGGPAPATAKSSFPRGFKHKSTISDTMNLPLDRQTATRTLGLRDSNNGSGRPEDHQPSSYHTHVPSTSTSDRDSMVGESQEDIQRAWELQDHRKHHDDSVVHHSDSRDMNAQAEKDAADERRYHGDSQANSRGQQPVKNPDHVEQDPASSSEDDDYVSTHEHQSDSASRRPRRDESRATPRNSMSAIHPAFCERDDSPFKTSPHTEAPPMPPTPSSIGRAVTSDLETGQGTSKASGLSEAAKPEAQNEGNMRTYARSLRPKSSTDYFNFITEAYTPPSLELRSPLENLLHTLSRTASSEEAERADASQNPSSGREVLESENPLAAEVRTTFNRNYVDTPVNGHKLQDSPVNPARAPDNEVQSFERLGVSAKTAKAVSGSDAGSTSTRQSQQHETSLSTSGRSSSSTFSNTPPSPSYETTPDNSRPHSQKSRPPSHLDLNRTGAVGSALASEETPRQRIFPLSPTARSSSSSRPASKEGNPSDDHWSRSALPLDLENHSSISLGGNDSFGSSPALVSTPTSITFADALKEEIAGELSSKSNPRDSLPPRAQSALDLPSTRLLPPPNHQSRNAIKNMSKLSVTVTGAPSSPAPEPSEEPLRPALKKTRNSSPSSQDSQALVSAGAAYLQEARKTVSGISVPSPRVLRPQLPYKNTKGAASPGRTEPMAKMLVECCSCHFFHDMPARVYECMAKPDSIVEDKTLGVSAAITTMVKCPWCAHGMTTLCCSGYAAVVYLKEKLHGK